MEGVEDIPFPVLTQGLPWNWKTYPDYLDALAARTFDVDIGSQLPHAALRVFVMGQRGADREPATAEDIAEMRRLAKEAMEAGAIGFGTSRTLNHRTSEGEPIATLTASEEELTAIALGMADAGTRRAPGGVRFHRPGGRVRHAAADRRGVRPAAVVHPGAGVDRAEVVPSPAEALEDAVAAGLPMKAQVAARPVGVLLGLELTLESVQPPPAYRAIAALPLDERIERLRDPALRERLLLDGARGARRAWARQSLGPDVPARRRRAPTTNRSRNTRSPPWPRERDRRSGVRRPRPHAGRLAARACSTFPSSTMPRALSTRCAR